MTMEELKKLKNGTKVYVEFDDTPGQRLYGRIGRFLGESTPTFIRFDGSDDLIPVDEGNVRRVHTDTDLSLN